MKAQVQHLVFRSATTGSWLIVILVAAVLANSPLRSQDTRDLIPRVPPAKPIETQIGPAAEPSHVVLKFREGSYVRLRNQRFVIQGDESSGATAEADLSELEEVLSTARIPTDAIERLHTRPENELDAERRRAQRRSGRQLADLNLYYRISVPPGVDAAAFCDQLNSLPFVELATPAAAPSPSTIDIPLPTPNFRECRHITTPPRGASVRLIRRSYLVGTAR
jgi:serine protease